MNCIFKAHHKTALKKLLKNTNEITVEYFYYGNIFNINFTIDNINLIYLHYLYKFPFFKRNIYKILRRRKINKKIEFYINSFEKKDSFILMLISLYKLILFNFIEYLIEPFDRKVLEIIRNNNLRIEFINKYESKLNSSGDFREADFVIEQDSSFTIIFNPKTEIFNILKIYKNTYFNFNSIKFLGILFKEISIENFPESFLSVFLLNINVNKYYFYHPCEIIRAYALSKNGDINFILSVFEKDIYRIEIENFQDLILGNIKNLEELNIQSAIKLLGSPYDETRRFISQLLKIFKKKFPEKIEALNENYFKKTRVILNNDKIIKYTEIPIDKLIKELIVSYGFNEVPQKYKDLRKALKRNKENNISYFLDIFNEGIDLIEDNIYESRCRGYLYTIKAFVEELPYRSEIMNFVLEKLKYKKNQRIFLEILHYFLSNFYNDFIDQEFELIFLLLNISGNIYIVNLSRRCLGEIGKNINNIDDNILNLIVEENDKKFILLCFIENYIINIGGYEKANIIHFKYLFMNYVWKFKGNEFIERKLKRILILLN